MCVDTLCMKCPKSCRHSVLPQIFIGQKCFVHAVSGGEGEAFKEKGNAAFKAEQYSAAVKHYSSAIEVDRSNSVYYSNRAMALLKVCSSWSCPLLVQSPG